MVKKGEYECDLHKIKQKNENHKNRNIYSSDLFD